MLPAFCRFGVLFIVVGFITIISTMFGMSTDMDPSKSYRCKMYQPFILFCNLIELTHLFLSFQYRMGPRLPRWSTDYENTCTVPPLPSTSQVAPIAAVNVCAVNVSLSSQPTDFLDADVILLIPGLKKVLFFSFFDLMRHIIQSNNYFCSSKVLGVRWGTSSPLQLLLKDFPFSRHHQNQLNCLDAPPPQQFRSKKDTKTNFPRSNRI